MADAPPLDESFIGETPLLRIDVPAVPAEVYAKPEWYNLYDQSFGGGSVKTRIGQAMLDAAEDAGDLDGNTLVVEPSSGNTGTALARLGVERGYDVEIVLPEEAPEQKAEAIRRAGGTVTYAADYEAMLDVAERRVEERDAFMPDQYSNPANPAVHARTTGPELYDQTDGRVTHFVAGAGTGGTVTGVARALRERTDATVVGYEPAEPRHGIDGLKYVRGPRFDFPEVYGRDYLDDVLELSTADAYYEARRLRERYDDVDPVVYDTGQYDRDVVREHLRVNGEFLVGPSSGGAIAAVKRLAERGDIAADDVVVIPFPDRGDRYADIPLWDDYL
ncbi:PLP-dependent cysteine synthase family protein [Halarchaeum sp. P4]|uniref:PLP-dependent cysteine synthase family protein n=1 Tax=Halarchaeum sp. P4 TaxID=3421639 RepID=UPI003EBC040A